jgi:hypothetical protein
MDKKVYDRIQKFLRIWLQAVAILVPATFAVIIAAGVDVSGVLVGAVSSLIGAIGLAFGINLNASSNAYKEKSNDK